MLLQMRLLLLHLFVIDFTVVSEDAAAEAAAPASFCIFIFYVSFLILTLILIFPFIFSADGTAYCVEPVCHRKKTNWTLAFAIGRIGLVL